MNPTMCIGTYLRYKVDAITKRKSPNDSETDAEKRVPGLPPFPRVHPRQQSSDVNVFEISE